MVDLKELSEALFRGDVLKVKELTESFTRKESS